MQEWLRSHEKYGDRADPSTRLNLDLFERVIDVLEHESGKREGAVPSLSEVEPAVASRTGLVRTGGQTTLEDLYNYWVQKRQRRKKPLLRCFWPSTEANNPDPHASVSGIDCGELDAVMTMRRIGDWLLSDPTCFKLWSSPS